MLLFGGWSGTSWRETWSLALRPAIGWSLLAPEAPLPDRRYSHVAVLDQFSHRMLVFGDGPSPVNDLWALSLPTPVGVDHDVLSGLKLSGATPNPSRSL